MLIDKYPFSFTAKKPTSNRFFSLFAVLLLCPLAQAKTLDVNHSEITITLSEAIEKSLRLSPALASYSFRAKANQAMVEQASIGEAAELTIEIEDGLGTGEYKALNSAKTSLSISWILEQSLINSRINAAGSKQDLVDSEQKIKRYDIASKTAHAFLSVLALQQRLAVAIEARQQSLVFLRNVKNRVNKGKSPLADQLKEEVAFERRSLQIEDFEHELRAAKRTLSATWGATSVTFDSVLGTLAMVESEHGNIPSYQQLQTYIQNAPDITLFLSQERILESEISLAAEEAKNRWRLTAGANRYERSSDFGFSVGVSKSLGSLNRNKGRIESLRARQLQYQSEATEKKINLSTRLYVLYEEYQHNLHLEKSLQNKILPKLKQASRETRKAYDLGKYNYFSWAALQNDIIATRMELIQARLQANNNKVEIERLTGKTLSLTSLSFSEEK